VCPFPPCRHDIPLTVGIVPLYFFDVYDGDFASRDSEGVELADRFEAGRAAIAKLRGIGGSGPPQDDIRRLCDFRAR
jgi:Domain of unknown function (DUF6894)